MRKVKRNFDRSYPTQTTTLNQLSFSISMPSSASGKHFLEPPVRLLLLQHELLMTARNEQIRQLIDLICILGLLISSFHGFLMHLVLLQPLQVPRKLRLAAVLVLLLRRNHRIPIRVVVQMAGGAQTLVDAGRHGEDMRGGAPVVVQPKRAEEDLVPVFLALALLCWVYKLHWLAVLDDLNEEGHCFGLGFVEVPEGAADVGEDEGVD